MRKFYIFALVATMFAACATDGVNETSATIEDLAPETLTVSFEGEESRIQLQEGKTVWNEGDLVSVFYRSNANQKWQFQGATGDRTGNLKRVEMGTATETMNRVVVVYPYAENYYINPETCNVEASLPATQTYVADSYGVGGNIMVSNGEYNQVVLKSVCGWLKLELTGNGESITSITLKGNNGEQVAGQLYINSADATAVLASEMGGAEDNGSAGGNLVFDDTILTEVTLDCGEGVTLGTEPTAFYIALPPQTFANGISLNVTATNGTTMTKTTENEIVIARNHILPMEAFEVEFPIPETWKIHYTATAKVTPYKTSVFGANIVSNEWDSTTGEGVITFDGEVSKIGSYAFKNCSSLTSVTIPDSVTSIGICAFSYCSSLTSVITSDNITSISYDAFEGCSGLNTFYGKLASTDNRCLVIDGVLTVFAPAGLTKYTIPNGINSIGRNAFQYCRSLTSVTIGNDVTSIGEYAFQYCTSLKGVIIGTNVSYIGGYAFDNCTSLTSVTIPDSVTSIGYYAFSYCTSLTSVTIPDSVTSIGNAAFAGCTKLTSIHITDLSAWCKINFGGDITTYDKRLYLNNVEITELIVPSDVVIINQYSFNKCVGLTNITIHDGVTSIGDLAFNTCKSLTKVIIGKNVTYVGKSAFDYCTKLKEIYCKPTTPPAIYYNDYNGGVTGRSFPLDIDIYVPRNSYSAYTQYTSTTENSIASVQNWYKYNSHINSYDFE